MALSPIERIRLDKAAVDEGFGLKRPDDGDWLAYDSLGAPASIRLTCAASNYLVAVAAVARRLARQAGLPATLSWQALLPLITGTLESLKQGTPEAALTGPVSRGDADTIRRHLAALSPDDARLYRILGSEALRIAKLDAGRRGAVERVLQERDG